MVACVQHALADLGAVRTGIGRGSMSDRELLDAVESLLALQRQVNGTVSVAMAAAEARDAAMRTLGTPLEAVLTRSGQESARQVRNQVFQAGILATTTQGPRRGGRRAGSRSARRRRSATSSTRLPATLDAAQTETGRDAAC